MAREVRLDDHRMPKISTMSRRAALKTLTLGASAAAALGTVPLEAARYIHRTVALEKAPRSSGGYQPKFFAGRQWETLRKLCEMIIPPDEKSGGALEANAPEFIDLLTSENTDYQTRLSGGLFWLDAYCRKQYGSDFLGCSEAQQNQVLDLIAYRKNSTPQISQGISFFSFLRNLTADGFYSSKIGIEDVGYVGNTALAEFPGCPEPTDA